MLLPGQVGCLLSHLRALERASAAGARAALLLEDDVVFADAFHARLRTAVARADAADAAAAEADEVGAPWGVLYLGAGHDGPAPRQCVQRSSVAVAAPSPPTVQPRHESR